ncbi:hypothetical protein K1T71_000179 [Dendrolimus kikuchii]|uniref:Uncharacterized protein n=1 Tax=Dendrolimus kikuchii TaxID=765133 RepID=A0ACC1DIV1_9NEOP|nr:hypothetical protein K1T71_000179 [Dendrolimus kikuchii]
MLQTLERYLKQAIVDKNPAVSSAALVSALHLSTTVPEFLRRWVNEAQEAMMSENTMVPYHALGVIYCVRSNDRVSKAKLITKLTQTPLRSPFALCLLIRHAAKLIEENPLEATEPYVEFIESCMRHKSEIVIYEAAHAIVILKKSGKNLNQVISVIQTFCRSSKATLRLAGVRILAKLTENYSNVVVSCTIELENLVTDSNRSVATLAVTTLLATCAESSIDKLIKKIPGFMSDISDEFKIIVVHALRHVISKYPRKHYTLTSYLAGMLRDNGGLQYKTAIVNTIIGLVEENSDARETGLLHLCEFIEDCEYTPLAIKILHVLGIEGPKANQPSRYIRHIYNRIFLDTSPVRAAAVSAVARFGATCPDLLSSIKVILSRCHLDDEDEVRDRAIFYSAVLDSGVWQILNNYIINVPLRNPVILEKCLCDHLLSVNADEPFNYANVPTVIEVKEPKKQPLLIEAKNISKISQEEQYLNELKDDWEEQWDKATSAAEACDTFTLPESDVKTAALAVCAHLGLSNITIEGDTVKQICGGGETLQVSNLPRFILPLYEEVQQEHSGLCGNKIWIDSIEKSDCSNSQSRRSHSSKSTHSGSNSSGSSGYGGKPSTSNSSYNVTQSQKRDKEGKKKKIPTLSETITDVQTESEHRPPETTPKFEVPKAEPNDVVEVHLPTQVQADKGHEPMDICVADQNISKDKIDSCNTPIVNVTINFVTSRPSSTVCIDGFSCVISMDDGVVMYTTSTLTSTLGFPKDMWIGRSFIDFVHPRDRITFASQITNGLAVPKIVNGAEAKAKYQGNSDSTMVCRIRRYKGLNCGFGIKDRIVTFMPFLLKFTFKNINDEEGNAIYLVIQATPFFSAFKIPNEILTKSVPFIMRHAANGNLEYLDPESIPYLGYLPQDVTNKNALHLYHPEDLDYLRQIYEIIVKEGGVPRSKPYRMMTQNGDFIKVATEWSSFINPWSRKLEFVIGKHHIIEGPKNPDVFQSPDSEKALKLTDEENNKAKLIRESIIRIMNEVLTKPAGIAKQHMSKRCRDLASFMENLLQEQPKGDEEFRHKNQDLDHSCYEPDSVMLGGISPHHDYNDSKSGTETPLSYNQLNYNETLQRYFNSQHQQSYEGYNTVTGENNIGTKTSPSIESKCMSSIGHISGDSVEMTSSCESSGVAVGGNSPVATLTEYQHIRLTEPLINKHNTEMEKKLMKTHRATRSIIKGTRSKVDHENRKKKNEHFARCNTFHLTPMGTPMSEPQGSIKCKGVKRTMKLEADVGVHKHHCPATRTPKRIQISSAAAVQSSSTTTSTVAANHWQANPVNNMNTFIVGVGIPQQMSIMSPVPGMAGVFPMYYHSTAATGTSSQPSTSNLNTTTAGTTQFTATPMQCMMYGSPFMYSTYGHQMPYTMQQRVVSQGMQCKSLNPLGLATNTYEETCKSSIPLRSDKSSLRPSKNVTDSQATCSKQGQDSADSNTSTNALNRNTTGVVTDSGHSPDSKNTNRLGKNEEITDKTDGESSYSSFYSSFFKTESGSAEESGDNKMKDKSNNARMPGSDDADSMYKTRTSDGYYDPQNYKKLPKRKMEPPWLEKVSVTSELIYKYQISEKPLDEVLKEDRKKMMAFQQPSLVNEQLEQLYLDLQLEGVAARLTLEEGITSSSSSSDETNCMSTKEFSRQTDGPLDGKRSRHRNLLTIRTVSNKAAFCIRPFTRLPSERAFQGGAQGSSLLVHSLTPLSVL